MGFFSLSHQVPNPAVQFKDENLAGQLPFIGTGRGKGKEHVLMLTEQTWAFCRGIEDFTDWRACHELHVILALGSYRQEEDSEFKVTFSHTVNLRPVCARDLILKKKKKFPGGARFDDVGL